MGMLRLLSGMGQQVREMFRAQDHHRTLAVGTVLVGTVTQTQSDETVPLPAYSCMDVQHIGADKGQPAGKLLGSVRIIGLHGTFGCTRILQQAGRWRRGDETLCPPTAASVWARVII